jgi:squalene-hopene/tetraprenyl-beta-curcumene cyclase
MLTHARIVLSRSLTVAIGAVAVAVVSAPVHAIDQEHYTKARTMIDRAVAYLRSQQDEKTGGWAVNPQGPNFPAITGLVVSGLIAEPTIDANDPAVQRGVEYMLSFRQPDGGIYDRVLPSYNTAMCLSALAKVNRPEAAAAIEPAINFLRSLQWSEEAMEGSTETQRVTKDHPFYGGIGYGSGGRPDNSNLTFFVQAMHDAGLSCDDPAYQRALVFLTRTQMDDRVNDMPYAKGSRQGGFIYATSPDKDHVGAGESKGGEIEETLDDGTKISRLRAYGSMTYAAFKSLIYANLDRDDQRVRSAYNWIRSNYTLEENPGVGTDGYYYYLISFSRALNAWGGANITPLQADGTAAAARDWQNDLVDALAKMQNEDGSFKSIDDRWMENNPVLITAYSLIALQNALP